MESDHNLLFGVLALQAGLIKAEQFVAACQRWSEQRQVPLADVLVSSGWLQLADKAHLEGIMGDRQPDDAPTRVFHPSAASTDRPANENTFEVVTPLAGIPAGPMSPGMQRYDLKSVHAVGGMGRVWLAQDTILNRDVALKELRPEVADDVLYKSRFLREARITGQLEHPGIVPVYEVSQHPDTGQPFYTMRFVRGRTLVEAAKVFHAKRRQGNADSFEMVSLLSAFVAVCNAVAYAHSHGIIHRDLKGPNVILGDFGEVIVLDWGLAKRLDSSEAEPAAGTDASLSLDSNQTVQGAVMGTPGYMAPEQAAGRLDLIDQRTDIYGLGALLYEILTGEPPFTGPTLEVLARVKRGELVPPRAIWPEVPAALEAACLRAMAREQVQRFASATELAKEVDHWQEVQRRRAEEALQRQTDILQSILDSMGEGVVVADETCQLLLINPMATRIMGTHPIGTNLREMLFAFDRIDGDQLTPCPLESFPLFRAIGGEAVDDAELFVRPPGKPQGLWISVNARPLRDKAESLKGGVLVIRDISERKRAEEELRRSRERFELAVQGSQDGLWDWDLQTNQVFYSPRWKDIIGYEDHEIAHRLEEWETRLHPEEREQVLAANYAHIDGTTPHYNYEYRLRHKDGSYRWILARGAALRDAEGRAYRMAGSHVDVTERKQNEQALQNSEERYQAIMACVSVGILVLDAEGKIRDCNANAQKFFGLGGAEIQGLSCSDLGRRAVSENGSPLPVDTFAALVSSRTRQLCAALVFGVPKLDGELRWLSVRSQPLFRGDETTPHAVVVSLEDVTVRRQGQ